jgi:Spy/CpxP family protein refolding chaperone
MKTLATIALALSLGAAPALASAQDAGVPRARDRGDCHHGGRGHHGRGDPALRAEHHLRMMTAILDLSAAQQAQVRQILESTQAERRTIREQGRSEATRAQMQALHERTEQRISAVLTPAQRATFDRVRAARREMGPRGR